MASPHSRHATRRDTRGARKALREADERIAAAARAAHDQQRALEARIRYEQAQAAVEARQREADQAQQRERELTQARLRQAIDTFEREREREQKRQRWPFGAARSMYRQGYTLEHCMAVTGWDADAFEGALEVQAIIDQYG